MSLCCIFLVVQVVTVSGDWILLHIILLYYTDVSQGLLSCSLLSELKPNDPNELQSDPKYQISNKIFPSKDCCCERGLTIMQWLYLLLRWVISGKTPCNMQPHFLWPIRRLLCMICCSRWPSVNQKFCSALILHKFQLIWFLSKNFMQVNLCSFPNLELFFYKWQGWKFLLRSALSPSESTSGI